MVRCKIRKPYEKGYYVENATKGTIEGVRTNLKEATKLAKTRAKFHPQYQFIITKSVKVVECK